jgi:hypothetical protein
MIKKTFLIFSEEDFEALLDRCFDRAAKRNRVLVPDEPTTDGDELLTPDETAKLLKVSKVTVWDWEKRGILNARRIANQVRYLRSEVLSAVRPTKNGKTV